MGRAPARMGRRRRTRPSVRIIPWLLIAAALAGCNARSHRRDATGGGVTIDIPPANSAEAKAATAPPAPEAEAKAPAKARKPARPAAAPEPAPEPASEPAPEPVQARKSARAATAASLPKPVRSKPPKPADASETADEAPAAAAPAAGNGPRAPLGDATIVGTIRRIGYSCDRVVSSNRVSGTGDGAAYKIVCASGDSYRATRRNGRLVFRLWSKGAADTH
jgi:outer membrane biosynthesis protein TonB